jgi:hypothetical protein
VENTNKLLHVSDIVRKKKKFGDHTSPQEGFRRSNPRGAEGGGATRDKGSNERERKQPCTRPAANKRAPAVSAASATEDPTKRT